MPETINMPSAVASSRLCGQNNNAPSDPSLSASISGSKPTVYPPSLGLFRVRITGDRIRDAKNFLAMAEQLLHRAQGDLSELAKLDTNLQLVRDQILSVYKTVKYAQSCAEVINETNLRVYSPEEEGVSHAG